METSRFDAVVLAFVVIPVVLAGALTWGVWFAERGSGGRGPEAIRSTALTAALSAAWMAVTWIAAASGVLRRWDRVPPPFMLLVVAIVGIAVWLAFSALGRRLATQVPLWALIGVQGFRLPLELAMHALVARGVMPAQMSYTGRNFDIITGTTAIVVAALVASGRAPRALVLTWNALGLALLANVVVIAILSTPVLAWFGPDRLNVFVTDPPFVWLPAVMVLAALAGHLLIFRALASTPTR